MDEGCAEPTLDDLLADPAMWLLMRRDGVEESDLRALLGAHKGSARDRSGGDQRRAQKTMD